MKHGLMILTVKTELTKRMGEDNAVKFMEEFVKAYPQEVKGHALHGSRRTML